MSFTIEQLPDEPIILVTYDSDYFDFREDPQKILEQITILADEIPERLAVIHDLRLFHLTFSDVVAGMAASFRSKAGSTAKLKESDILIVGGPDIVQLAVRGARQAQYGGYEVIHFEAFEDAIQSARNRNS